MTPTQVFTFIRAHKGHPLTPELDKVQETLREFERKLKLYIGKVKTEYRQPKTYDDFVMIERLNHKANILENTLIPAATELRNRLIARIQ